MEKIECVVLYNAKPLLTTTGGVIKYTKVDGKIIRSDNFSEYADIGMFTRKIDAFSAIEVYKKVLEVAKIDAVKPTDAYKIDKKIFPEEEMPEYYYNNVQEFIDDNLMLAKCKEKIGKDKFNKILVSLGVKMDEQHEKIIERMISENVVTKKLEESKGTGIGKINAAECKDNIKVLTDILGGKL